MTLRTPRRRISPQTRRRCKAIKGFFKRALGSLSQPDLLQITSSIAVNVTDINHKISGLEKQLQEVSKSCRENPQEIYSVRPKSPTLTQSRDVSQREISSGTVLKGKDTTIIYANSANEFNSSDPSDCAIGYDNESKVVKSNKRMNPGFYDKRIQKEKSNNKGNDYDTETNDQKPNSIPSNFVSTYSTSSFHSLDEFRKMYYTVPGISNNVAEKRKRPRVQNKNKTHRKTSPNRCEKQTEKIANTKKSRHNAKELDQDFIADIIRRQYKPVKFGRRNSDLSQFSVPVCRDHEFFLPTNNGYNIPGEHALCNCGTCFSDFSDIRSVYDARLYNLAQNARPKHRRRHVDAYDKSDIYDLVPVKEKSSPKTRRKFLEDNMRSTYYKEVPPSPKTHRPQFNLKARRYAESDCNLNSEKKISPKPATQYRKMEEKNNRSVNRNSTISPKNNRHYSEEFEESCDPRENQRRKNNSLKEVDAFLGNSTISGSYRASATEEPMHAAPVETPFNKSQETAATDKTDQALCEIKDILQSFLLEIKKEASSHNQKLNVSTEMTESGHSSPNNANIMRSPGRSFTNISSPHCPVVPHPPYMPALPPFGNNCCYPLIPMCPINCMQNSCMMPSASSTQNNYVTKSNKACNSKSSTSKITVNETCETDELIKKIYKFVSQSPTTLRTKKSSCSSDSKQEYHSGDKALTSRSVGGSTRYCIHDAKVGTPKLHCVSKSCEAIKLLSENSDVNVSYSDTVLDKLSLQATQSTSDTESSSEVSELEKVKTSKFSKVLQSLGLASKKTQQEDSKKYKKDVIEELSESESTTVEEKEVKKKPPFRQNITNYAMHRQEYYSPLPISPHYYPGSPKENRPYSHDVPCWNPRLHHSNKHGPPQPQYRPGDFPTGPPYSQSYESYNPMQPQVPLCLKEVEVKSIGCQSERKFSFFRKITQKMQQPSGSSQGDGYQRNCSTQTLQIKSEKLQNKSGMFNWKNPPKNFMDGQLNPKMFGFQTQKKLAMGDMNMRNAMLKKMFYKRNPFSPRNLIVRTLMGKDKSSFGDPPPMNFRPRMFV